MDATFPDIDSALAAAFSPETECVPVYARNLSEARESARRTKERVERMRARWRLAALVLAVLPVGCWRPASPAECIEFCKPWEAVGRHGSFNTECDCQPARMRRERSER